MDMSLASAGANALAGFAIANINNGVAKFQAAAANTIRAGNNAVAVKVNARNAEITALQRWRQGVTNSRVYEAVAANQEALTTNFNRARDAKARTNFSTSIRAAEESGRQQAAAAASGVTGSVVDVIDTTSRLRRGMERTASVAAENQMLGDYDKQEFAQRWATLDSLDYSLIFDNQQLMDNGTSTAQTVSPWSAAISAGLGGKDTLKNVSNALADFKFGATENKGLDGFLALNDNFSQVKV